MTGTKRTSEEPAPVNNPDTKRARHTRSSAIPAIVPDSGQRASSNHEFLDDTTSSTFFSLSKFASQPNLPRPQFILRSSRALAASCFRSGIQVPGVVLSAAELVPTRLE